LAERAFGLGDSASGTRESQQETHHRGVGNRLRDAIAALCVRAAYPLPCRVTPALFFVRRAAGASRLTLRIEMRIASWTLAAFITGGLFAFGCCCSIAQADAKADFQKLLDDSWEADLQADPLWATQVGDHRFDAKLPDASIEAIKQRLAQKEKLSARLNEIDRAALSREDQINYDIFARLLADDLAEAKFETYLMPITNRGGFHTEFPELYKRLKLITAKDYENYIARMAAFGEYADQHIALMRAGIEKGLVLPAVVLKGYRDSIVPHVVADPEKSLTYRPFLTMPGTVSDADQSRLRAYAKEAIAKSVVPAYRRFLTFMEKEYVAAAPGQIGAAAWPDGRDLYRHRIRSFTTLDITPEEVHQRGLDEVKRIRGEMEKVIQRAKFDGSIAQFIEFLRTDPQFYAKTPKELFEHVGYICKRIDGELPRLFKTLPRTPYGLREIPAYIAPQTTSAYYMIPTGNGETAGFYYLNTYNLKSRPLYEMEALSLHEAVPGHHLQLALQQELTDLPKFRRHQGFTVFVEGWALYAERLGLEVGFYQDPYTDFGRLTFEMWRACRLVVDTGIHFLGWERQRAIDFMAANTALSLHNIAAEVDRYISWPGQAVAYKIGELKIRDLRANAEKSLGDDFDIRDFHHVVLGSGSVPLAVLEDNVNDYIKSAKKVRTMVVSTKKGEERVETKAGKFEYPKTRKGDQTDDYHGTKVADPYRWLEDPDSDETKAWVEAQNKVTFGYLESLPEREGLRKRLTELWNYERYGIPRERGGKYFYERNDGLQNQSVLYVADSLDAEPRVLLDPNKLSKDGTVALSATALSEDGKLIAYATSGGGSDWREWKVRDVETGKDMDDHLKWSKFSGASWKKNGKGFYYSRYDEPKEGEVLTGSNYFQKLHYHEIGTPQSNDELFYERPDQKEWGFEPHVTDDGRYLIIHVWRGSEQKNAVFFQDLGTAERSTRELLNLFDAEYDFIGNVGRKFYFRTDYKAARGRIICIDLDQKYQGISLPPREREMYTEEIVAEAEDTLEGANIVGGRFILRYLKNASSAVKVFDLEGKFVRDVKLPGIGTVGGFAGKQDDKETFYAFTSYTSPGAIYRYEPETGESTLFREPKVAFDRNDYVTEQVFAKSKDGTRVPIFLSYKKGLNKDGRNPTILYAYGGFNIPLTPSFSVTSLVWMEQGGLLAVANLRGGGEYGRTWHEAGMLDRKQNVFDDFQAAAEWLIENKYTSSDRLAIQGGSNGGLLVGACMTQRPDLYAVALPAVGVMDMLRFQKFTIGWAWVPEYGSSEKAEQFANLYKYSPLHNLKAGTKYPATLITTADHDDRVVPAHSFKFAAALQEAHGGERPVMIRIETRAGHGAGKPTSKRIEEAADILAFTRDQMGVASDEAKDEKK
jgi:prolyl oligopeptidase